MTVLKLAEAAQLLGISDDTLRRWADQGRLEVVRGPSGRLSVEGVELARVAVQLAEAPVAGVRSARNNLRGVVTRVLRDTVMAQVDVQAGPYRLVSLMSREAADDLALDVGTVVVASVKATNVVVELEGA